MKQRVDVLKWTGIWLFQIPIYLVTSYVIRSFIGGVYTLIVKAGANLPPNFLLWHMLWVSLLDGFLAGLIGLAVVRAMLLLRKRTAPAISAPWARPQAWTWVLPTCWLVVGVCEWLNGHVHHSVLSSSSSVTFSDVAVAFFGSGCELRGSDFSANSLQGCFTQMSYTHPWLGTIAYSAATFVSPKSFGLQQGSFNSSELVVGQQSSESAAQ